MRLIKYSKLTNEQKVMPSTIIGFKNNVPTTYAKNRSYLGWDIMQHRDRTRLSKNKSLITIRIKDSLKDVITFFHQNKLTPHCPIDKHVNIQLKKQLTEENKNRRRFPRKKVALNGEFFHSRTKRRGGFRTQDISFRGLKFTTKLKHNIGLGDTLMVNFVLKDVHKSRIIREIKTRHINERQIGAEIINPPPLDPDLGFYLME
ncbi:MAG: PilZ domain-containing protein [Desulfobacteraceae bacterium]|nr:PilZ domain-containing protein [Desulfobacteraceae bacterium]